MNYTIDAANQKLGRLASNIAVILQGKQSPSYEPRKTGADRVIVKNLSKLEWNPERMKVKFKYSHTTQIGHLKQKNYDLLWHRDPERVLRMTVRKMLPKNKLNVKRLKKLVVEL